MAKGNDTAELDLELHLQNLLREKAAMDEMIETSMTEAKSFVSSIKSDFIKVVDQESQLKSDLCSLQDIVCAQNSKASVLGDGIKRLDKRRERVSSVFELVKDLLKLRECAEQSEICLKNNDLVSATNYVSTFRKIFAKLPSVLLSETVEQASITSLKHTEAQVISKVRAAYDEAIRAGNKLNVSTYARLFNPLNLKTEGISRYIAFIRSSMADQIRTNEQTLRGNKSNGTLRSPGQLVQYIVLLCADLTAEHQGDVRMDFGPANFLLFIRGLYMEACVHIDRIVSEFLRSNSSTLSLGGDSATSSAQTFTHSNSGNRKEMIYKFALPPGIHVPVIDEVLTEAALLCMRMKQLEVYVRNVARSVIEEENLDLSATPISLEEATPHPPPAHSFHANSAVVVAVNSKEQTHETNERDSGLPVLLNTGTDKQLRPLTETETALLFPADECGLFSSADVMPISRPMDERAQDISAVSVSLENFMAQKSIHEALELDEADLEDCADIHTTPAIATVFFILERTCTRAIMIKDSLAAATVVNNIAQVINDILIPHLQRCLQDSKSFYEAYVMQKVAPNVSLDGGLSLFAPAPSANSPAVLLANSLTEEYKPSALVTASIRKDAEQKRTEFLVACGIEHFDPDTAESIPLSGNHSALGPKYSFTHAANNIVQSREFCSYLRDNLEIVYRREICEEEEVDVRTELEERRQEMMNRFGSHTHGKSSVSNQGKLMTHAQFANMFRQQWKKNKGIEQNEDDKIVSAAALRSREGEFQMFLQCLENIEVAHQELLALEDTAAKEIFMLLRPLLSVPFTPLENMSFEIDSAEYNRRLNSGDENGFVRPTANVLRPLLEHIRKYFLSDLASRVADIFAERVARRVELAVLNKKFTLLGGIGLDENIQALQQFFSMHLDGSVRIQFTRLTEIASLLTLEDVKEFREVFGSALSSSGMRLRPQEVRKFLLLRVDFNENDVNNAIKSCQP